MRLIVFASSCSGRSKKVNIYVSSPHRAASYAARLVPLIEATGHAVTSRWMFRNESDPATIATLDRDELDQADCLGLIVGFPGDWSFGGMWWELGYATASNFVTHVIGEVKPGEVFTTLATRHFDDCQDWFDYLAAIA